MKIIYGSFLIGLLIGFIGQRSRMCFIGGFRDFLLIKDKELLKGTISFFASAWLMVKLLKYLEKSTLTFKINFHYTSYPTLLTSITSDFGIISFIGGLALGLFSTLAGGCPLRQHVLSGQGRVDSLFYLIGFYSGIFFYYIILVKIISFLF